MLRCKNKIEVFDLDLRWQVTLSVKVFCIYVKKLLID